MKHALCRLLKYPILRCAILYAGLNAGTVVAQDDLARPVGSAAKEQCRQVLLRQLDEIQAELQTLDEGRGSRAESPSNKDAPVAEEQDQDIVTLDTLEVIGYRSTVEAPKGRSVSTVEREDIKHTRGFAIKELFEETPGIFSKQGNGPRDVGISIRGSGAKQGFGVRNVKVYEAGRWPRHPWRCSI